MGVNGQREFSAPKLRPQGGPASRGKLRKSKIIFPIKKSSPFSTGWIFLAGVIGIRQGAGAAFLPTPTRSPGLPEADGLEISLRSQHIKRLTNGQCDTVAGIIFLDTLVCLERISDHARNIAEEVMEQLA